jgi:putative hydrolase of the HAD superfamily
VDPLALISFDLDGVLQKNPFAAARPDGVFGRVKAALAPYVGLPNPEEAAAQALRQIFGRHRELLAQGQLVAAYDWDEIVNHVAAALGCPARFDIVRLVEEGCEVPGLIWSYPGAADCLQALTDGGHILVSTTNGYKAYQEPVLRKLGLLHYFREMISPEMAGAAKPQPAIFRVSAAKYPGPYIHVGDTLLQDVAGARAAGFAAIYICQVQAPDGEELPPEIAALAPWERPAVAEAWLAHRRAREMKFDTTPPAELQDCMPDAIVARLEEVPKTVAWILGR